MRARDGAVINFLHNSMEFRKERPFIPCEVRGLFVEGGPMGDDRRSEIGEWQDQSQTNVNVWFFPSRWAANCRFQVHHSAYPRPIGGIERKVHHWRLPPSVGGRTEDAVSNLVNEE